jgi:hypothetical protein
MSTTIRMANVNRVTDVASHCELTPLAAPQIDPSGIGGGHTRVVHAGDREPHDESGADALLNNVSLIGVAERMCDPECRVGRDNGDKDRCSKELGIVVNARFHLHGSHAGVVHAGNAKAHQDTARDETEKT